MSIHCACQKEAGFMEGEGVRMDVKQRHGYTLAVYYACSRMTHVAGAIPMHTGETSPRTPLQASLPRIKSSLLLTLTKAKKHECTAYCPPKQETLGRISQKQVWST